jgi:hypothetical protein
MLSPETIRRLSQGSDGKYFFDFSLIPGVQYESLFRILRRFGQQNILTVGFSCDALVQSQGRTEVQQSIAQTKMHCAQYG